MSTFYVNKKGLDSASAGGHPEAIPLKYKDLKGTTEFTLYTKPVSIKKMQAATSLSEYFRELFPQACFVMLRCTELKPKSAEVKAGDFDHCLQVFLHPQGKHKVTSWLVKIEDDHVEIQAQI
jgi:hypothetical protein